MIKLLIRLAYFVCIFIEGVIGLRIILHFINAKPENYLVQWVTNISNIVTMPFQGIVDSIIKIWKFELPSVLVVSLFFYIVAGIVLSELLKSYRNND